MYRIRRFGVMKTATVVAIMYMVIVAVFVVPFLLLALVFAPTQGSGAGGIAGILVIGFVAIFAYGLIGWVATAIAAAVYNLAAGWVGGIEVQVESVAPPPPLPTWATQTEPPALAAPPSPPPAAPPPAAPAG